jgi:hypothetical protein
MVQHSLILLLSGATKPPPFLFFARVAPVGQHRERSGAADCGQGLLPQCPFGDYGVAHQDPAVCDILVQS